MLCYKIKKKKNNFVHKIKINNQNINYLLIKEIKYI